MNESTAAVATQSFAAHCARVEARLEDVYGIRVVTRDMPGELKGDLDGLEIHVDPDEPAEARLFLLAHLFGHTVQWNTNPRAFELGMIPSMPVEESLLAAIVEYEQEAARYALTLLHESGVTDLDQWFFDYSACDKAYLLHFYRTAERKDFRSFWVENSPPVAPLPIPPFTPQRRKFRMDGVVI